MLKRSSEGFAQILNSRATFFFIMYYVCKCVVESNCSARRQGVTSPPPVLSLREPCEAAPRHERRQEMTNTFKVKEESYFVMPGIQRINVVAVIRCLKKTK